MPLLTAHGIAKAFGMTVLLDGAELHLVHGERVGLVGLNGSGKSTLLRILAGQDTADDGSFAWRRDIRVTYLSQRPDLREDDTLIDVAMAGARRNPTGWDPHEQEAQSRRQLSEMGVTTPELSVGEASGGNRRRAAVAAALLEEPDLLLLDEPTNHLDVATVERLEKQLCAFPGAIVLITHDRYFLNVVVDRILEMRQAKLWSWPGTFEDYLAGRVAQEDLEARNEHGRKRRLATELDWLRRSPKARTTKQKARIQRAEALMTSGYEANRTVKLEVQQGVRLGKKILDAKGLDVGFVGHKPLVKGLDLSMTRGVRIGVVGDNGVGKTTLLRTLIGQHDPRGGSLQLGINTTALYIDQERSGLDPKATVRESGSPSGGDWVMVGDNKVHIASWLERFLFRHDDLRQKVSTLSGGQRFRLLLARRLQQPMNLLVLDEPTNDLDFETLRVLEEALIDYAGCLVIVSHDRCFMDRVCTHVLELEGAGSWQLHTGNWSEWQARKVAQRREQAAAEKKARAAKAPVKSRLSKPKLSWKEQKRLEVIESEIERAEEDVAAAEAALDDPAVTSDYTKLQPATDALEKVVAHRDALYAEWETLEERVAEIAAANA